MWDPGFHFEEVRLAELAGHQRRFSYRTTLGRGSPERPALMLALEPCTGSCRGLVFRIAADVAQTESAIVWRREMVRGGYRPKLLPVSTPQGEVAALAFTSNPSHADYVGELSLMETASIIAGATGVLGTNRHYLEQLAVQLERLGIEDAYVRDLAGQVQVIAGA
jgi:cation transport protein ChaC